uniref:DNA polymerase lambda n=1 Tax=viral metagenome TaxID=1070528 RepID=A0A6C0AY40_9ZZZZ|tara:strand:- start:588 stop:3872 length:3285 start_codon:yes stop_codon:yes gene_type:complete
MNSEVPKSTRLNGLFTKTLSKLASITKQRGENFQSIAYTRAEESIVVTKKDITSYKDLIGKPYFGENIIKKLEEVETTGKLNYIEKAKEDPVLALTEVYGIGPSKARDFISKDIKSVSQLKQHMDTDKLTYAQNLGLKYFNEINKRIPREKIINYEEILKSTLSSIDNKAQLEIAGSYRRKLQSSGDIDVIISHPENTQYIFSKFLDKLKDKKIILGFLSRGKQKSLTIAKLEDDIPRRIDFIYSSPEEYPFALLYFTGSKSFNTVMRHHANKLGYTLNEHGIYKYENKKKGDKVLRDFTSEEDIFAFLNLKFRLPEERIEGSAVVNLKISSTIIEMEDVSPNTKIMNKMKKNIEKVKSTTEQINPKECDKDNCSLISAPSVSKFYVPSSNIDTSESLKSDAPPFFKPSNTDILNKINKKLKEKKESLKNTTTNMNKTEQKEKKRNYKQLLAAFNKDGYDALDNFSEYELSYLVKKLNDLYYNGESLIDDNTYDIVKQKLQDKFPDNEVLNKIGAPVKKQKAKLPYFMASMDKIKPDTDALEKWVKKYNSGCLISAKLDGISGLYTTEGEEPKLYTRGDGEIGQDISDLIPYFKLPKDKDITIRGEFIIQKSVFSEKYADKFSNGRNFVAGVINSKKIEKSKYYDIDFVAYEVIKPVLTPKDQIEKLQELHVDIVLNDYKDSITNDELSQLLLSWRDSYKYEIDGIIVVDNKIYERENKNPDHGFAFKMVISDQIAEALVVDVLWDPSKDGYLKPRIRIEPITLGGAKIEYATAFNAGFVEKNKLGIGAMIKLVRSGDVIPHILDVVTPASEAKFPHESYEWNDTHVDILLKNPNDNEIVQKKNIEYFFKTLKVVNLGPGMINKLVKANYNTIGKILEMTVSDYETIEGIKHTLASKIYKSIEECVEKASLAKIMTGSNVFGHSIAREKIKLILENYSNVLTDTLSDNDKIEKIKEIKGMAQKTSEAFVNNIPKFIEFLEETKLSYKLEETKIKSSKVALITETGATKESVIPDENKEHDLYKRQIVFTGFRDETLIKKLEDDYSVKISNSVSKNTYLVLAKNPNDSSGKVLKAKELNIPVMSKEEFDAKYIDI